MAKRSRRPSCEVCGGPLGHGRRADEGVCQGCEYAGAQWAHRQLARLWNAGLNQRQISEQLGYAPRSVNELVARLRRKGVRMVPHQAVRG
jgi:hypothetical protein